MSEFRRLLGVKPTDARLPEKHIDVSASIPTSFDSRTQWAGCVGPVLDQGHCGSCWAFGAIESLQDRFCIHSNGKQNVTLSEQDLVSCDSTNDGCDGGQPISAWDYLKKTGAVTAACYPYEMGTCHHPGCTEWNTPQCNMTCANGGNWKSSKTFAASAYSISSKVPSIQTEIMTNGPVEVTFAVYEDFANYQSGVYSHVSGSLLGYHAVKNVGWGTANGTDYWIIQNSWNPTWGIEGFFWIKRGVDECGIEDQCVAGLPKL